MTALRPLWLRLHRWCALGLGWILIVAGFTGALLVLAQPLDRWAHSTLFRAASGVEQSAAPLAPVLARARQEFGAQAGLRFRLPQQPGDSLWLRVQSKGWKGTLYLDPATGLEQGRRGDTEGFANTLFKLHSTLLLGANGKALLAWAALAYGVLLLTGVILWWPRHWPGNWHVKLRKSLVRALFDLHRIGGVVMGLLIAASVLTGAYLAWRPLGDVLNVISRTTPVKAPRLPEDIPEPLHPTPNVDALLARARAAMPDGQACFVQVPTSAKQALHIRFRVAGEPHPNGISSVWLDPRTGAVLAAQRWYEMDPGTGVAAIAFPLHTGALGGVALQIVAALNGLALAGIGASGLWLWWHRHRVRVHALARRNKP